MIQQGIDQMLRIGSALLTQTDVYKRQAETNVAGKRLSTALKAHKELGTERSSDKALEASKDLFYANPTKETYEMYETLETENIGWKLSQQKAVQERESKIAQKQAYRDYMRLMKDE